MKPSDVRLVGLGEALVGLGLVLPAAARGWAAVAGWAGAILAAEAAVFDERRNHLKKRRFRGTTIQRRKTVAGVSIWPVLVRRPIS